MSAVISSILRSIITLIVLTLLSFLSIGCAISMGYDWIITGYGLHPWIAFTMAFANAIALLAFAIWWAYTTGAEDVYRFTGGTEPTVF